MAMIGASSTTDETSTSEENTPWPLKDTGTDSDNLSGAAPVPVKEIAYRLRYVLGLAWLTVLQYGSIGPSVAYICASFFAGDGNDCEAEPDSGPCKRGAIELAFWRGLSNGVSNSVAWALALVLGSWSDTIGRRPLFRCKAVMSVLPVVALALHVGTGLTLWVYLVMGPIYEAFDINGVFLAFMSDVIVEKHERASAFGVLIVGVIMGGGAVLPLAGLLPAGSAVIVALVAAALKLVYMFTVFPETSRRVTVAPEYGQFSFVAVTKQASSVFGRNSFIFRMSLVLMLSGLSLAGLGTVSPPIVTGYLGMKKDQSTGLLAVACGSLLLSMAFILRPLERAIGEVWSLRVCLAVAVAYPLAFMACTTPLHVVLLTAFLFGPLFLQFPIISSIKSNLVAEDEQGLVQGALAAVRVVATAVADIFFGWFFRYVTDDGEAPRSATVLPLLGIAGLAIVALIIGFTLPLTPPRPPPPAETVSSGSPVTEPGMELREWQSPGPL